MRAEEGADIVQTYGENFFFFFPSQESVFSEISKNKPCVSQLTSENTSVLLEIHPCPNHTSESPK